MRNITATTYHGWEISITQTGAESYRCAYTAPNGAEYTTTMQADHSWDALQRIKGIIRHIEHMDASTWTS